MVRIIQNKLVKGWGVKDSVEADFLLSIPYALVHKSGSLLNFQCETLLDARMIMRRGNKLGS